MKHLWKPLLAFVLLLAAPALAVAEDETVISFRVTGDVRMFVDGRPVKRIDITTEQPVAASGGAAAGASADGEAPPPDEGAVSRMGAGATMLSLGLLGFWLTWKKKDDGRP